MKMQDRDPSDIRSYEDWFDIADVRLIAKVPDHESRTLRDVVVEEFEINSNGARVISGTDIEIEKPQEGKQDKEHNQFNEDDTPEYLVHQRTWRPELSGSPIPAGVIDELRGKYSKFRTRHEPGFIAKREAEVEREAYLKDHIRNRLMTPSQLFHESRLKKANSEADSHTEGEKSISTDLLAQIGETMAKNSSRTREKRLL
jgi:large subunit ribosomal protein L24